MTKKTKEKDVAERCIWIYGDDGTMHLHNYHYGKEMPDFTHEPHIILTLGDFIDSIVGPPFEPNVVDLLREKNNDLPRHVIIPKVLRDKIMVVLDG